MYNAVDVYLEKRENRHYVGRLSKKRNHFVFEYKKSYIQSNKALPIGPDLPVSKIRHSSLKLFPSFADRIPSKRNPAYKDYCQSVGIAPSEENPFVLLAKLGKKGPSSFIIVPVRNVVSFSGSDLKQFRESLKLSIREFADLFDVSTASIHRIESGKIEGIRTLKKISSYRKYPQIALSKIKQTGYKISDSKREFVENFLSPKISQSFTISPFTVRAEYIERCSPKQAVELLKNLLLMECHQHNIPQNSVHISSNIPAKDGGQDALVKWIDNLQSTNYFPRNYNCFQVKAQNLTPKDCEKEIVGTNGQIKPAIQNVIQNKGSYILCSTYRVAGINKNNREWQIAETLKKKGYNPDDIAIRFYDADMIANWMNNYPSIVVWFSKEILGRDLSPWLSWREWSCEDGDYRSEFMSHADLEKKKRIIRHVLSQPKGILHLTGASGLGKTRLALEALRPPQNLQNNSRISEDDLSNTNQKEDLSPLVMYSSADKLNEQNLRKLKSTPAILVIDDCSLKKINDYQKIVTQEDSKLRLLTIGDEETTKNSFTPLGKNVEVINLEPDKNIVKKILTGKQNVQNLYIDPQYDKLTSGFPLMAKLLRDIGPIDLLKADTLKNLRNKMLWGVNKPASTEKAKKVIEACSLFDTICIEDILEGWRQIPKARGKEEAEYIAKTICNLDYETFYEKIQFFKQRKIIQQHGRFIQVRPKPLAIGLASDFMENIPKESITKWLTNMIIPEEPQELSEDEKGLKLIPEVELTDRQKKEFKNFNKEQLMMTALRESFCKQLAYCGNSPVSQNVAKNLCGPEGFFGKKENLLSKWGLSCFYHLAELDPETALLSLENILGNKSIENVKNITATTWYGNMFPSDLIWILQKIARSKNFYPHSARLLLKLAEAEQDINQNQRQAENAFIDHFQLYLSGTEAPPELKFKIIDEIQNSSSIAQKEIAIKALEKSLEYGGSRSLDMTDKKTGREFKDWQAETYGEIWDYFCTAMDKLVEFAIKCTDQELGDKELGDKAFKIIAFKLDLLLRNKLYEKVEEVIKKIINVYGTPWPKAINSLNEFLKYHSNEITKKERTTIVKMIQRLEKTDDDIQKKIKLYVTNCPSNYLFHTEDHKESPKYKKSLEHLIDDFEGYIEKESPEEIKSILKELFYGEQNNTLHFAYKLGQKIKHPLKFGSQILDTLNNWKNDKFSINLSFLAGFLSGLNQSHDEKTQKILDNIANNTELRDWLLPFAYNNIRLKDQDVKRLIKFINESEDTNLHSLQMLSTGKKCKNVSPEKMKQLLTALIQKEEPWCALSIYFYYIDDKNKKDFSSVLYSLLKDIPFLDQKKYTATDNHHYQQALKDILDSEHAKPFSEYFISQLFKSKESLFDLSIGSGTIKKCVKNIFNAFPEIVLSGIISNKNNHIIKYIFKTESFQYSNSYYPDIFSLRFLKEKEEVLKKWCEKESDIIPAFLMKHMPLFKYSGGPLSPLAKFILDEYGDKPELIDAININLSSFSWSGKLSEYFKKKRRSMEELIDHRHQNVKDFASKAIYYLKQRIEEEEKKEKEREELDIYS